MKRNKLILIAEKDIPAGLHPFDRTARPQIVNKTDNSSYHGLIKAFEELTGVGALMNTSFVNWIVVNK